MMKSLNPKVNQFIEQFTALYDGQPWYGDSLCQILENVTPRKGFWQPAQDAHSIAQLISHLIYWRQSLIKRLAGDLHYKSSMQSDENWKSNEQLKKEGWKSLMNSLAESQAQLLSLLSKQKDSLLKKKYSDQATFQEVITGILQHDLYHTGQIAYIKSIYPKNKK